VKHWIPDLHWKRFGVVLGEKPLPPPAPKTLEYDQEAARPYGDPDWKPQPVSDDDEDVPFFGFCPAAARHHGGAKVASSAWRLRYHIPSAGGAGGFACRISHPRGAEYAKRQCLTARERRKPGER
jgi:hypothetical protein